MPNPLKTLTKVASRYFSRDPDAAGVVPNQRESYYRHSQEMTPDRFLDLALPLENPTERTSRFVEEVLQQEPAGQLGYPFLNMRWDPEAERWDVLGHEGRHRMSGVREQFPEDEIPVDLFLRDQNDRRIPSSAFENPEEASFRGLDEDTVQRMQEALGRPFLSQDRNRLATAAPLAALTAATAAPSDAEATWAGKLARNAPIDTIARAVQRLNRGDDPRDVWSDTGWFRDTDDKMKWEIDDFEAKINPKMREKMDFSHTRIGVGKLEDLLMHDKLYEAYPELRDMTVSWYRGGERGGSYSPDRNSIRVNSRLDESPEVEDRSVRETLIHEITHALQERENFAKGGTPELFSQLREKAIPLQRRRKVTEAMEASGYDPSRWEKVDADFIPESMDFEPRLVLSDGARLTPEDLGLSVGDFEGLGEFPVGGMEDPRNLEAAAEMALRSNQPNYDRYRNIAGERQAFNAQRRANMTADERRQRYPLDTVDRIRGQGKEYVYTKHPADWAYGGAAIPAAAATPYDPPMQVPEQSKRDQAAQSIAEFLEQVGMDARRANDIAAKVFGTAASDLPFDLGVIDAVDPGILDYIQFEEDYGDLAPTEDIPINSTAGMFFND